MAVNVKSFSKSKSNSNNGGSGSGGNGYNTTTIASYAKALYTKRKLWGNDFDGTQDVNGDIYAPSVILSGNCSASGNATYNGDLYVGGTSVLGDDVTISGDTSISGGTLIGGTLRVTGNTSTKGNLYVSGTSEFKYPTKFDSSVEVENTLTVNDDTYTQDIYPLKNQSYDLGEPYEQWNNLYCKKGWFTDIDVTGQAHFKEVVIDKIKATGGNLVVSPATFHVDKVGETYSIDSDTTDEDEIPQWENWINRLGTACSLVGTINSIYTVKLLQYRYDKNTGKETQNEWEAGDYVYCQTFNIGEGVHTDVSNKYYRSVVVSTGRTTVDSEEYNYIEIITKYDYTDSTPESIEDYYDYWGYGTVAPEEGDEIVMLGSMNSDNQSAIMISACQGLDNTVTPPSICQYANIAHLYDTLSNKKVTQISPSGNIFKGSFKTGTGLDVETMINDASKSDSYLYTAYCNNLDGYVDFTKTNTANTQYNYLGICASSLPNDSSLVASSYTWTNMTQKDYEITTYKIVPSSSNQAYITADDSLHVFFDVDIYAVVNGVIKERISSDNIDNYPDFRDNYKIYFGPYYYTTLSGMTFKGEGDYSISCYGHIENAHENTMLLSLMSSSPYIYATLYKNNEEDELVIDEYELQIVNQAGALFEVNSAITASISDVNGNINKLSATAEYNSATLQNMSGDINTLSATATTTLSRIADDEGDISTLKQTASSLTSTISELNEADNKFIGTNSGVGWKNYDKVQFSRFVVSGGTTLVSPTVPDIIGFGILAFTIYIPPAYKPNIVVKQYHNTTINEDEDWDFLEITDDNLVTSYTLSDFSLEEGYEGSGTYTYYKLINEASGADKNYRFTFTRKYNEPYVYQGYWYVFNTSTHEYIKTSIIGDSSNAGFKINDSKHWECYNPSSAVYQDSGYAVENLDTVYAFFCFDEGSTKLRHYPNNIAALSSEIRQSANEISLYVNNGLKKTGIDITNGQIELNADNTLINGQLSIDSSNNADSLVLVNSDGNAVVKLQNTSLTDSLSQKKTVTAYKYFESSNMFNYQTDKQTVYTNLVTGDVIRATAFPIHTLIDTSTNAEPKSKDMLNTTYHWYYTWWFYIESGSSSELIGTMRYTTYSASDCVTSFTYTVPSTYNGAKITAYAAAGITSSGYEWNQTYRPFTLKCTAVIEKQASNVTVIGSDGMISMIGDNKYIKIKSDGIQLRWGNDGLFIDDDGVKRMYLSEAGTSYYGSLNKYNVKRLDSTAYVLSSYLNYDFLVFSSSETVYFGLDTNPMIGHTIRFKKLNSGHLYISPRSHSIYVPDSHSTYNASSSTSFDIGDDTWEITYIGNSEWVAARMN